MHPSEIIEDENHQTLRLDIQIKRHDGRRWVLSKDGKPMAMSNNKSSLKKQESNTILMAIAEAHTWKDYLIKEQIIVKQLAHQLSINPNFIYKRL